MNKYHIFLLSFLLGSCHVGEEYHHTEIITPYDVQENLNLKKTEILSVLPGMRFLKTVI